MKRFVFLWSSLLFSMVGCAYIFTISMFFSWWFVLLAVPCAVLIVVLIHKIGLQARVLTQAQKSYLANSMQRQGYSAFFTAILCALIIERNPFEQCVYATTFGIALFSIFMLCFALRNYLNSFDSLWTIQSREKTSEEFFASFYF